MLASQLDAIHALRRAGRLADAVQLCRRFVEREPTDAEVAHLLGLLLSQLPGRAEEAIGWLRRSVELRPAEGRFLRNLAAVLLGAGRVAEAAEAARRAVAAEPADAEGQALLGNALQRLGQVEAAERAWREVVRRVPPAAAMASAAQQGLAAALLELGRADEAIDCYRDAMQREPGSAALHSQLLFAMQYSDRCSAAQHLAEARRYGSRFAGVARTTTVEPSTLDRTPGRRLRVGYLSPDFRRHTIPHVIEPVLRHHDRGAFKVFCYSCVREPDDVTARLAGLCDHFVPITTLADEQAAARIRADRIDILVDPAGHMGENRLPIFARRAAPVQVQLAYAGTTGLATMDYKIADPRLAPDGMQQQFTERLLVLPETAWVYHVPDDLPPIEQRDGQRESGAGGARITFGCLNNPAKLSNAAVALWSAVLKAVPDSRLLVLSPVPNQHLLDRFARDGIDPSRIELTPRCGRAAYLALFNRIDIALDPTPYAGDTTTCEALLMGVPVITLAGHTLGSRRGVSILHAWGLPEWIARTPEQYVMIARDLAISSTERATFRRTLRQRVMSSPLTDGLRYTRALEAAYRQVCQALPISS